MSAAILQEFGRLRRKEWSTGPKGYTTLYIISCKAVYATHWWENIYFDPEIEWRDPPTQTNAKLFKLTVTDTLRDGEKYHRKLDADLIENDYVRAYLILSTQQDYPNAADYTIQWNQIRDTVGELVPMLQDQSRWTDIAYETVEEDEELF
ncbi:hypothetical protein APSETT444_008401 [Aspergillus pseudonomiae]